jgi:hypothetical protein
MPDDDLKQAAQLHRRWRGIGPILFAIFYSLFFAAHLKLEKTAVYLKDDVVFAANTAAFFTDLTSEPAQAGARGSGQGSAFLLLHHHPARVMAVLWLLFSDSPVAAARHAVAAMTSAAGALTVVLLYLTLMCCGVARLRAVLFASVLGVSTAVGLFAALPQPQIFSALGLMAALAAVARWRAALWWEFPVASFYACCCSLWNIIPILLLVLVGAVRDCRAGGSVRPLFSGFISAALLLLVTLGAMKLQSWAYPGSGAVSSAALMHETVGTLSQASRQVADVPWTARMQDVLFANVIAPTVSTVESGRRTVTLAEGRWLEMDVQHCIGSVWLLLLLLGLIGLPWAMRSNATTVAALLLGGWLVLFHGSLEAPGERLLNSSLWTPAVIALVGLGVEQPLRRWSWLQWPVMAALGVFLVLQTGHNGLFIAEIAKRIAL